MAAATSHTYSPMISNAHGPARIDSTPAVARQAAAIDHTQYHARQHYEYLSRSHDPEPLVREPAEQRRQLRMIDDHAGHREPAQPVDASIALASSGAESD